MRIIQFTTPKRWRRWRVLLAFKILH